VIVPNSLGLLGFGSRWDDEVASLDELFCGPFCDIFEVMLFKIRSKRLWL